MGGNCSTKNHGTAPAGYGGYRGSAGQTTCVAANGCGVVYGHTGFHTVQCQFGAHGNCRTSFHPTTTKTPGKTHKTPGGTSTTPGGTSSLRYGVGGQTVAVCVAEWFFTYDGTTQAVAPAGCSGIGRASFALACTGAPMPLSVSYTLKLMGNPITVYAGNGQPFALPPFNPGPYSLGSAYETVACSPHANSEPSTVTWGKVVGPAIWPANGSPATVQFYPSAYGGFGYAPVFLGFSSAKVTNYPPNTWHIATDGAMSQLSVYLYAPSEGAGPGSLGPYHVAATGSYEVQWGTQYQQFQSADLNNVVIGSTSQSWTTWAYALAPLPGGGTKMVRVPVYHVQTLPTFTTVGRVLPAQVVKTWSIFHTRVDQVSGSWNVAAVLPTVSG